MDSWTEPQLAIMKTGGNDKCNEFLQKHGIGPRTPIKQKYESPAAQLYKQVLKARVEGKPEPTVLPSPVTAPPRLNFSNGMANAGGGGGDGRGDPNGMERLMGETDQEYIARQTRLREEAKQRMAAKFGGGGMGGVGSSGGRMQGIGSDPSYNPNSGYGGGMGGGVDMNSFVSSLNSAVSSVGAAASTLVQEDTINSFKQKGSNFWGSLTTTVSNVAANIAAPSEDDGLSALQRQVASNKPAQSAYAGFGSDQYSARGTTNNYGNASSGPASTNNYAMPSPAPASALAEAPGLPGEDRNGIERLTGESDQQYIIRQTRLREEARARMAAKFGGGGLSSASSSASTGFGQPQQHQRPMSAPNSGNGGFAFAQPPAQQQQRAAPPRQKTPPPKQINSGDFFSNFGA